MATLSRSTTQRFVWDPDDDDAGFPDVGMFASIEDLPPDVRRRLDERQQRRWLRIVNETFAASDSDDLGVRRNDAIRTANDSFPLRRRL